MQNTGRIVEWNAERGFGYLEHDGRHLFLHIRDFAQRTRQPETGDVILFVVGTDKQGRSCAKQARHRDELARLRISHGLILLFLILPGVAVYRVIGPGALPWAAGWVVLLSALTWWAYYSDKQHAREKVWRISEAKLHLFEVLGGWPGAFFAQRVLRHKSSKGSYLFVYYLIIGLHQAVAFDALRGWPMSRALLHTLEKL